MSSTSTGPVRSWIRALDALRRESGVDVAAGAVQGVCRLVLDADCDPEPVAAVRTDLPLGGSDQRRRDAAAAVLAAHGDVMKFSRIRQRQVDVAERSSPSQATR